MEAAALPTPSPVRARLPRRRDDARLVAAVRAGDDGAFGLLAERHTAGLVAFCRHMLGTREEAEDAVQHTLLAAYRAMRERDQDLDVRPWLYTIARNRCLSVLRARRDEPHLDPEAVATEGLAAEVARRAELRELLGDLGRLPEDQRAALVLFELGDHSHQEIARVLGVRREKVKALVFQAREHLVAARRARETSCDDVRGQLATLRGGQLRRGPLRRHVEQCAACRAFERDVRRQRAALAIVLPVTPTAGLEEAVLAVVVGGSGGLAATTGLAGVAAAGAQAALAKVLVTLAAGVGAGAEGEAARGAAPRPAPPPAAAPYARPRRVAVTPTGRLRRTAAAGVRPRSGPRR